MRTVLLVLVLGGVAMLVATAASGGNSGVGRVRVPGRLSVRVPPGWHLLHGWLSDVSNPAPRLAAASFPARLSGQTCECGSPNVIHFPRSGAFVFVWEYLHPSRRMLAEIRRRPAAFRLTAPEPRDFTCQGPSDDFTFKLESREFQVEVYLGQAASPATRTRMLALLDSLRTQPDA